MPTNESWRADPAGSAARKQGVTFRVKRRQRNTKRSRRVLIVQLLVGAVVCCSGYALTATMTVNASKAGSGAGVVTNSSFVISQLTYQLDSTDPTLIANVVVTFSGTAPAGARASIGGTWSNACTVAGSVFTCVFGTQPDFPNGDSTALRVVATS
jgi:hypothetical protein